MDKLEEYMLTVGKNDCEEDMKYIQELLDKQKEKEKEVEQLILLFLMAGMSRKKLFSSLEKEINKLFDETHKSLNTKLKDNYENSFLATNYGIYKTVGMKKFDMPSKANMNWHIGGKSYKDDLLYYKSRLLYDLKKNVDRSIVMTDKADITNIVKKPFKTLNRSTKALVDTELTYVERQGTKEAYKTQDIEEYRYVATLDTVTCSTCGELDGKTFPLKEAEEGVNYPPMHPNCRCTTVGIRQYDERAAKTKDGERIFVSGNMTYEQWKEKYLPK